MPNTNEYKINPALFYEVVSNGTIAELPEEEQIFQKLYGISDEVLKKYYTVARRFFDEKKWSESTDAFTFLTFLNPYVYDFWICLGVSEQCQGKFQEAITAYTFAEATNPNDPVASANLFQCALALNEQQLAWDSLDHAIECCGEKLEHQDLKNTLMQFKK